MCSALQDPVAWSDMPGFDLSATPPRHSQPSFTSLLQERIAEYSAPVPARDKSCSAYAPAAVHSSSKPSQSATAGRKRRRERSEPSPLGASFLENISNSPKKTPTKSLPFTPSRVSAICFLLHHINSQLLLG